jgi:hypothetical protein
MFRSPAIACLLLGGLMTLTVSPASAALIYESAASGPTGQTSGGGNSINDAFYLAVNFQVVSPVQTGSIGGHLIGFGGGTSSGPSFSLAVRVTWPPSRTWRARTCSGRPAFRCPTRPTTWRAASA